MPDPILVVGGSTAGISAARELRTRGFEGVIQILDQESSAPYRRPAVSKGVLSGAQEASDTAIPWPEALGLERLSSATATGLDLARHRVTARRQDGSTLELAFSQLVVATGSEARPLTVPGRSDGTISLRHLPDGVAAQQRLVRAERVVVIGAGFIGLEVAAVARKLGKEVVVIEAAPLPLAHAVGSLLGSHIAELHRSRGVRLLCGVGVRELQGGDQVERVLLESGETLEADLVVGAVGSAPVTGWLGGSGLDVTDGVLCDRTCAAVGAEQHVVVAGDVARWFNPLYDRHMRVEHWTNAIEQGTYAARRLLGVADPDGFSSAPYFWSDQYDAKIQSVGSAYGHDETAVLALDGEKILVAYGRQGVLVAVAGVNAGPVLPRYRPLIESRSMLSSLTPAEAARPA